MDKDGRRSTDTFMRNLMYHFTVDMRTALDIWTYTPAQFTRFESRDPNEFRKASFVLHDGLDHNTYKWLMQFNGLIKRYVFEKDLLTPAQREEVTNVKFVKLQERLACTYWKPRTFRLHKVLSRARAHSIRILSGFSPQSLEETGRFGTKATIGCTASEAYIDQKLCNGPITGSAVQLEWFKTHCEGDSLLSSIVCNTPHETIDRLQQVNVPKKFNIDRGINPNTLIGSYYSCALGRIVEDALRKEGLDIRRLQQRHQILARRASTNNTKKTNKGKLATADLSDASHGYLSNTLNALLPREWYRAVMKGVIRQVEVSGSCLRLESIMTMGIGFTFPMQTLLFYCLLKALSDLTGITGVISVYGDDLIYPVDLHPYVVQVFDDLGFKMNLDKTFVHSHFKESCGSDFFRGMPVRPYCPEGSSEKLGRVKYAAFCYKILNGLLVRWDWRELEHCVNFILQEIVDTLGEVFLVPMHMPDFSGFRVQCMRNVCWAELPSTMKAFPISPIVRTDVTSGVQPFPVTRPWYQDVEFKMIRSTPRSRYVIDHSPYYWDWLRTTQQREVPSKPFLFSRPIIDLPKAVFKWRKKKNSITKKGNGGEKIRKLYATVPSKDLSARYSIVIAFSSQSATEEMVP